MYYVRKLKPDRSITGLLPAFASVAIFAFASVIFGLTIGFSVLAILIGLYSLYSFVAYLKTNSTGYLIASLYQLSLALLIWSQPRSLNIGDVRLNLIFLLSTVFFLVWLIYLLLNNKLKWRGREILEMAAEPVDETADGFTDRPLSAGKIEYAQRDILAFANFARQNLIAITYIEKDKVVLVPIKMGEEYNAILGLRPDYNRSTWVAFDKLGNVSVNISRKDYLNYKENLSFDQLCASLGDLFVEFLELFTRGEGVRIIDRMDAVGLNPFS